MAYHVSLPLSLAGFRSDGRGYRAKPAVVLHLGGLVGAEEGLRENLMEAEIAPLPGGD